MKLQHDKRYMVIAIYAFSVLAAAMLFWVFLQNAGTLLDGCRDILRYLQPVLFGAVIAFLLNPLLRLYDDRFLTWAFRRKRVRPAVKRGLAIALTYLTAFFTLLLFGMIVLPQLITSLRMLPSSMPNYIKLLTDLYSGVIDKLNHMQLLNAGTEFEALSNNLIGKLISLAEGLMDRSSEIVGNLFSFAVTATTRVTAGLLNAVVGLIISIYILFDREKLFAQMRKIATALLPARVTALLHDILQESNRVFTGFIVGKVIDSIIIGILCFFGMVMLRLPYAVLISFIVGVTNVIPYFGPFIGAIPGIILILLVSPIKALWFAIFILVLQQFDGNVLGPKILGDTTGLSALWVIFAITLFGGLLGIAGVFIGVPLFAVIYSLIKRLIAYILSYKGKSTNTRDYDSEANRLIR